MNQTTPGRQRMFLSQSRDDGTLGGELEEHSASSSDSLRTQAIRSHPLPHSISASVVVGDVRYTGYLFPESARIITMSEDAFNALLHDAQQAGVDVSSGSEYREAYT